MSEQDELFAFDDSELGALLDGTFGDTDFGGFDDDDGGSLLGDSEELRRTARQIVSQYMEVITTFAGRAFGGRSVKGADVQLSAAADSLTRLAVATEDRELIDLLDRLGELILSFQGKTKGTRRQKLARLRNWLVDMGQLIGGDDGERLAHVVTYKRGSKPLLDRLAAIRGIGPRRLERLYAAGLFSVEVVGASSPEDIALVTGLPRKLAHEVVAATQRFEREQHLETLEELARLCDTLVDTKPTAERYRDDSTIQEREAALEPLLRAAITMLEDQLQ